MSWGKPPPRRRHCPFFYRFSYMMASLNHLLSNMAPRDASASKKMRKMKKMEEMKKMSKMKKMKRMVMSSDKRYQVIELSIDKS